MLPADYDAWYHTPRGQWIADTEWALLNGLIQPTPEESLLDVGSGTGYFTRRFAADGLRVTGLDPDNAALDYAHCKARELNFVCGDAQALPFSNNSFDYCAAVTSLCFIKAPELALQEMWRVCRRGVLLGLLNRHSLLYWQKHGRGGYTGARWDQTSTVQQWIQELWPAPKCAVVRTGILLPGGSLIARLLEKVMVSMLPFGGFMVVYLEKDKYDVSDETT